ncbi:FAD-dependent oxidoreductase [Aeromicrobium erythreum]|uniref:FAD-dependent oxidoreductase n=1 Tax=Aeromicrobium erythreum TaxID=2041 RepID=UPI000AAAAFD8|nr:FAD-dependent oxidoreductase [Aeromicrobium erythreum]
MDVLQSVVIGAGQAGLSASYHLARRGVEHVVLDADDAPGGAWQHRWDALTMADVHGVAELPDAPMEEPLGPERANVFVPAYFAAYEREHHLPVERPVAVQRVTSEGDLLVVTAGDREWRTRTLVNATGTWRRPFVPRYPGQELFRGEQLHTVDYPGPEHFRGKRVLVVGGGASAVQFLGALRPITDTLWATRREPVWRTEPGGTSRLRGIDPEAGREAVALVEERVRAGLPPRSVVSVTGLMLREQEREAERLGAYERLPMFDRLVPDGAVWDGPPAGVPGRGRRGAPAGCRAVGGGAPRRGAGPWAAGRPGGGAGPWAADGTVRARRRRAVGHRLPPRRRPPRTAAPALPARRHPAGRHAGELDDRRRRPPRAAGRLRAVGVDDRCQPSRPGRRERGGADAQRSR